MLNLNINTVVECKKSAAARRKEKDKKSKQSAIVEEKKKVKKFCAEIEDELLAWNCIYYHISPKCFIDVLGEQGLELGEVYTDKLETEYLICWHQLNNERMR